jgi:hypothetical protein
MTINGPGTIHWDGRFRLELVKKKAVAKRAPMTLAPLGREGWARIKTDAEGFSDAPRGCARSLPSVVRLGRPALRDRSGVYEVPHLGYRRHAGGLASVRIKEIRPLPPEPLAGPVFGLAESENPV